MNQTVATGCHITATQPAPTHLAFQLNIVTFPITVMAFPIIVMAFPIAVGSRSPGKMKLVFVPNKADCNGLSDFNTGSCFSKKAGLNETENNIEIEAGVSLGRKEGSGCRTWGLSISLNQK